MQKKFHGSQFLTDSHENQHRLSSDQSAQKLSNGFFNVDFVCPLQPIKFGGDSADFDVNSYLGNALAQRHQIWWHTSRLHHKCWKKIWCHLATMGRYYQQNIVFAHISWCVYVWNEIVMSADTVGCPIDSSCQLFVVANCSRRPRHQTGSLLISRRWFDFWRPNLVGRFGTPSKVGKKFGVIRPLGGAVISKIAFLLFSLDVLGFQTKFSCLLIMWNVPFQYLAKKNVSSYFMNSLMYPNAELLGPPHYI